MLKSRVLIIGQGLAGTVLCHELEQRGIQAVVVDNSHHRSASKVAAGLFNPFVFKWTTKSWNIDAVLPVMQQTYTQLEDLLGVSMLHQTGILRVISSQVEKDRWDKKRQRPDYAAYLGDTPAESGAVGMDKGFGQIFIRSAGWLDIQTLIEQYTLRLKAENRFMTERFDHSALEVGKICRYKDRAFDEVIFCEGAGVDQNPFFSQLNFSHTKGEVLDITDSGTDTEICVNYGQFIVPRGDGQYRIGTTYAWNTLDDVPTPREADRMLKIHSGFFGSEPVVTAHKAGVRPTAADRRPFVGRHPEFPSLSILNGTGSKGVLLAPWCAQQLVDHLLDQKPLHPEVDLNRKF